jgi:hypothetical protein
MPSCGRFKWVEIRLAPPRANPLWCVGNFSLPHLDPIHELCGSPKVRRKQVWLPFCGWTACPPAGAADHGPWPGFCACPRSALHPSFFSWPAEPFGCSSRAGCARSLLLLNTGYQINLHWSLAYRSGRRVGGEPVAKPVRGQAPWRTQVFFYVVSSQEIKKRSVPRPNRRTASSNVTSGTRGLTMKLLQLGCAKWYPPRCRLDISTGRLIFT